MVCSCDRSQEAGEVGCGRLFPGPIWSKLLFADNMVLPCSSQGVCRRHVVRGNGSCLNGRGTLMESKMCWNRYRRDIGSNQPRGRRSSEDGVHHEMAVSLTVHQKRWPASRPTVSAETVLARPRVLCSGGGGVHFTRPGSGTWKRAIGDGCSSVHERTLSVLHILSATRSAANRRRIESTASMALSLGAYGSHARSWPHHLRGRGRQ